MPHPKHERVTRAFLLQNQLQHRHEHQPWQLGKEERKAQLFVVIVFYFDDSSVAISSCSERKRARRLLKLQLLTCILTK